MTALPPDPMKSQDVDIQPLLIQLRRKEGNWVGWAKACQALRKAGLNPQQIFEDTGFEAIHQNQITVAVQVYDSLLAAGVDEAVTTHFEQRGSDQLYELRVLSQSDRAKTAAFILQHGLDADQVKDLVKPIKEYAYRKELPPGFSDHPGDAVAFHYWTLARQKSDLQDRSRLIAQGLRYVHSPDARQRIEQLLTDFTVVKARLSPSLPLYRLETETELPRILPVAGQLPLNTGDFKAVPVTMAEDPFGMVHFTGTGAWVAAPGWQVIFQAEDPVGVLTRLPTLPNAPVDAPNEEVLVICDRTQRDWRLDSYFLADIDDQVEVCWFEEAPSTPLLGRIILVMRPKKILDENYNREPWQIDE